jgi:hypothetical protein
MLHAPPTTTTRFTTGISMSEYERPEEAAERDDETTAPRRTLTYRVHLDLLEKESRGYDPYNANTGARRSDVWRRERKRT